MENKFSLVIPTYNEAKNIKDLCFILIEILKKEKINYEIIIVDDNSPDETWKIAENLAKEYPCIKVIRRINKRGLGSAVVTGWEETSGNILGVIDGDLQHPPELLPEMIKKISQEIDIVIASRNITGGGVTKWSPIRRFISWLGTLISSILLSNILSNIKDPMSGYFILNKRVINGKKLTPSGYKILLEVLAKCDYKKVIEIPYFFKEREKGGSKAGIKQYIISLIYMVKLSRQIKKDRK